MTDWISCQRLARMPQASGPPFFPLDDMVGPPGSEVK